MLQLNPQTLFCFGLLNPKKGGDSLLYYLREGRSLNKDKDKHEPYLEELNKLNSETKFWVRYLTGNIIEITEITDAIAKVAVERIEELAKSEEPQEEEGKLKDEPEQEEEETKEEETKTAPEPETLYSNVTNAVYNATKNITDWVTGNDC